MRIGAHISSAGGPQAVFERAAAIQAEAVQLFISAPQQWRIPPITADQVTAFRTAREAADIPAFFHGVYLVNLGSDDEALLDRSKTSLKQYVRAAGELGVVGTVFHLGSHKGAGFNAVLSQACGAIAEVLKEAPNDSLLMMENNAGQGGGLGSRFAELGQIVRGLGGDRRLAVCLDTCHAFAMGYDLATSAGCDAAIDELDREVGLDRLMAVHANDSKTPLGGIRDRHENIGDGCIGYDGFRTLMSHPAFRDVPFLLEVPGIDGKGPDLENIQRLKRLRSEAGVPAPAGALAGDRQ